MRNKIAEIIQTLWAASYKYIFTIGGLLLLIFIVKLFSFAYDGNYQNEKDYINTHYQISGLRIPKDINFCGEKVPLSDFMVTENLDRELLVNTYWQSQTLLLYKRANRWFPVIETILKRNGIPNDFKYIPVVESALTNIVSPAKATGYWQFIEETGKNYGLVINEEIDERYSIEKSTEAACKYFKEAYKKFNNWTLVAASYNMGMSGLADQLEKQKANNYYNLYLNDETARYVFRILAVKDILSRPKAYGFALRKQDLYHPFPTKNLIVDSSITSLSDFALKQGFNYKIIKLLNPWLRSTGLNNPEKKVYAIALPKKDVSSFDWDEFSEDKTLQADTSSTNSTSSDSLITHSANNTNGH